MTQLATSFLGAAVGAAMGTLVFSNWRVFAFRWLPVRCECCRRGWLGRRNGAGERRCSSCGTTTRIY